MVSSLVYQSRKIAVVIPSFNEADAIGCVVAALKKLKNAQQKPLIDQLVVCDNGSDDGTGDIAVDAGAEVIYEPSPGYGSACLAGLAALDATDVIVFVDGDHSVDYADIPTLINAVINGADLAPMARSPQKNEPGALTPQQIFGNKLACWLIRLFWQVKVADLGPLRAISSQALSTLQMRDRTYGWTVEMQVKAIQNGMCVEEYPTGSRKRIGQSKISGTVKGTVGAAFGIIGMILRLRLRERRQQKVHQNG